MGSYPKLERADYVNEGAINVYLDMLFGYVDWEDDQFLGLRPQGEKGTMREGHPGGDVWLQPALQDGIPGIIANHARRWATHEQAAFIIPAVMSEAKGTSAGVALMTALMVDIDSGDTMAAALYLEKYVGMPTMVVASGGVTTETGHKKLHVYYKLTEPSNEIDMCVRLREEMALKVGGDAKAFGIGRAHQPIRIPGTCYAKGGAPKMVEILHISGKECELSDLSDNITDMKLMPGIVLPSTVTNEQGSIDLDNRTTAPISQALTQEIHEGGEADRNRWSEFTRVAGHHLWLARQGMSTLVEAYQDTLNWMVAKMTPVWPQARFDQEFKGLLNADIKNNGPMPAPMPTVQMMAAPTPVDTSAEDDTAWDVTKWVPDDPPEIKHLVHELLVEKEMHMLFAPPGVGKSFLMMDLALALTQWQPTRATGWLGQGVYRKCRVMYYVGEDSKDEISRRMAALDVDKEYKNHPESLWVFPQGSRGGMFRLVEKNPRTESWTPTAQWSEEIERIKRLKNSIGDIDLVIIDPFNYSFHGNENDATDVGEYLSALQMLTELGCAVLIVHHTKKDGSDFRGSSAFEGGFRVMMRIVPADDYERVLKKIGEVVEPNRLFDFFITKANFKMLRGQKRLLRDLTSGILRDVTRLVDQAMEKTKPATAEDHQVAWLGKAVGVLVSSYGIKICMTGKHGLQVLADSGHLPPKLKVSSRSWSKLTGLAIDAAALVKVRKDGTDFLDVPDGSLAKHPADFEFAEAVTMGRIDWDGCEAVQDGIGGPVVIKGDPRMST